MQSKITILLLIVVQNYCFGQSIEKAYPKTLLLPGDTFYVKFSTSARTIPLHIPKKDTIDMGTDGTPGMTATIYYGKDSLIITHSNFPYPEVYYIPFQLPARRFIYRLHFNSVDARFSHSTQNFATYSKSQLFRETVMFICGPDQYDRQDKLNEQEKAGLMSGIVFTEIDHNYVNPATYRYAPAIDSIFSNRAIWTAAGGDQHRYASPMAVFNEYMTHAVFCLWIRDNYD